jgi:hypothetical protein
MTRPTNRHVLTMTRVPRPLFVHHATSSRSVLPIAPTEGGAQRQKSSASLIHAVWHALLCDEPVPHELTPDWPFSVVFGTTRRAHC